MQDVEPAGQELAAVGGGVRLLLVLWGGWVFGGWCVCGGGGLWVCGSVLATAYVSIHNTSQTRPSPLSLSFSLYIFYTNMYLLVDELEALDQVP